MSDPAPRPPARASVWTKVALVLVIVALALGSAGAALWWWTTRPVPVTPLEAEWLAHVMVLAGTGARATRDGDTLHAAFTDPFGLAVARDGSVYVSDGAEGNRIRRITPDGHVTTVAGAREPGFVDGPGDSARFDTPSGLAIGADGALYVADTGNHAIRRVTVDGRVETLAGNGMPGDADGYGRAAAFNGPMGVAIDGTRVIVADSYNDRIRSIAADGTVSTLAGALRGNADGSGAAAAFDTPCGVAVDGAGRILVADTNNGIIRTIDRSGAVATAAWSVHAALYRPIGIAIGPGDRVYVTDERGRIVEGTTAGAARVLAGSSPGFRDGDGVDARFREPTAVAVEAAGRLIVADSGNALIRTVAARARMPFRPPPLPGIRPAFDAVTFGMQPLLWPVAPFEGPHEVAGTIGEARGGQGGERFHAGIDVRIDEGTPVHAIRDGVVVNPITTGSFGTLNEWLRIGPLTYVHIRAGRDRRTAFDDARFAAEHDGSKVTGMRVRRGTRFAAGETIGSVNPFNHVHLNLGWPGEELNPLRFDLVQFEDTRAPTIPRGGVLVFDEHGLPVTRRVRGRLEVSGRVQIVVDAWDQADGNRPDRRLGLYDLGYQILDAVGSPVPGFETTRHTMRFDRLAPDPATPTLVYAPGSGIPFYGRRRTQFLYIVTNTLQDGIGSAGYWDSSTLSPGDYTVRVWAADIRGNAATANRDLPIRVVPLELTPAIPAIAAAATRN